MERISIFNYEAFLLDYIEGNLDAQDTELLLAFLRLHPELDVDLNEIPRISQSATTLDSKFKESLKMVHTERDVISDSNIESFLIACDENELSHKKSNELAKFLSDNPKYNLDKKVYALAHLKADIACVFPDKSSLKRKKILVLWPYWNAAAVLLLALLLFNLLRTNPVEPQLVKQHDLPSTPKNDNKNQITNSNLKDNPSTFIDQLTSDELAENSIKQRKDSSEKSPKINLQDKPVNIESPQLALKTPELVKTKSLTPTEPDGFVKEVPQPDYSDQTQDIAQVNFDEMNNPIRPLTKRLSNATNTEMDFRLAKADVQNPGGFYVKIGGFELSRKTYK